MLKTKQQEGNIFYFMRGRVALYSLLKAIGLGPGDEVIMQAFTCLAVPAPVLFLGARAVYIDIDPLTYNIDTEMIEERITQRTRAIILQHTFGIAADIEPVRDIARRHGLTLIEDCCHAIGTSYKGREVGSFGDAAFYSTEWAKPINTGIGGLLIVNNPELRDRVIDIYRSLKRPPATEVFMLRLQYLAHSALLKPSLYWHIRAIYRALSRYGLIIGTFSRSELKGRLPGYYSMTMSEWQKRVFSERLKGIDEAIEQRRRLVSIYEKRLLDIGIRPLDLPSGCEPVFIRYPILVRDKEAFLSLAQKSRIEIGDWFISPVHPKSEPEWGSVGYEKGSCPRAEWVSKKVVNLPVHPGLNESDIERTLGFISENRGYIIGTQSEDIWEG